MTARRTRRLAIVATLLAAGIGGAGTALANEPSPQSGEGGGTLVIGKSFDLVTMDPGRMFETDRRNHHPGDVRHAVDVPEQRRHRADARPRRELGGQRGRHRVHVHAARRRRLLRRLTRRGRRRRLLAQPGARTEEQRRVPDGRRHGRGGRRVDRAARRPRHRTRRCRASCRRRRWASSTATS